MQDVRDLLVVGAGPVGLACALEAARAGLSHVILERGALLNTLVNWPTHVVFFSTPELLEIGGHPFVSAGPKPTRREGLDYYRKVAVRESLDVRLAAPVLALAREDGLFVASTPKGAFRARAAVVATGFFDTPNLLGVPGEDLPNVSHYYREPYRHALTDVLVVGGKNSAVEAALDLHRHGARVTMAVRGPAFGASVKYWLRPDVENRVREGSIRAFFGTTVARIEEGAVVLRTGGAETVLANDFVYALTGYRPDFGFLRSAGIAITEDLAVVHDPATMETSVPGLYVAGVVAAGRLIGSLFIENGRAHAARIVSHLLERRGAAPSARPRVPPIGAIQDGD
ncbi:MAG TPA: YpdA family putative bacillithiol disulfide reductase [Thermoanaerobaculia bacterium]|nr:YpdA family putative bacillithiol disulfide reductase [Thermoanaerobaculia bacterium]